jgi:hypothetical protein
MLNHSTELGLDRHFVNSPWLSGVYGDDSGNLPAYQLGEQWLTRAANGRIYLDARDVAACSGKLVGALRARGALYAACAQELLLVTPAGDLIESVTAGTGLAVPVTGLGAVGTDVVLQAAGTWWIADLDAIDFSRPAPAGSIIAQLTPGVLPAPIRAAIPAPAQWLSWERLLLDMHSGRIAGRFGVLWVDIVGALLATLASSGIAMWWLHRRRRGRASFKAD